MTLLPNQGTVPIYYEGRLAKPELKPGERPKIDPNCEETTEGAELGHKEKLNRKWAALESVGGAEKRINLIAEDFVKHLEARLEVMDGKAMIVCMSRRISDELYEASGASAEISRVSGWGAHAPRVLLAAPRRNFAPAAFSTVLDWLPPFPSARRRGEHARARVLPEACETFRLARQTAA